MKSDNEYLIKNKTYYIKTNYLNWLFGSVYKVMYEDTCVFWSRDYYLADSQMKALNGAYLMGIKDTLLIHNIEL